MPLSLADLAPLRADMASWAMEWHPRECCGLIVERAGALEIWRCENLQDKLHAADPDSYKRSAVMAYNFDPRVFMRAEGQGGVVRAIFHSHTDAGTSDGAYFSDTDILDALGGDSDGDPLLPGIDYIVLSARASGVDDLKLFRWNDQTRTFEEQER